MRFLLFFPVFACTPVTGLNWLTCNCNRVAGLLQPSDSPVIEALFVVKLVCMNFMGNFKNAFTFFLNALAFFLP